MYLNIPTQHQTMNIRVAKHAGFCFGVRRAIQLAQNVALKTKKKTYVPGQLVHNEVVIKDLESKGIEFVDKVEDLPQNATTVLRAHGEPGKTYDTLKQKAIQNENLTDATCPLVTLVHNVAKQLIKQNYEVVIYGKFDHPETIGTRSHLQGQDTFVVEKPENYQQVVDHITKHNFPKVAIISQTTMSVQGYKDLIDNLSKASGNDFKEIPLNMKEFETNFGYVDTICQPTKLRQSDTEDIAQISDVMIVIGGKNSSNSKELVATSKKYGIDAHYIQTAQQLKPEWFVGKKEIGVTAGASTPDSSINEVVEKIKKLAQKNEQVCVLE